MAGSNHPSRAWRRRAEAAADTWPAEEALRVWTDRPADAEAILLTPEQVAAMLRRAYVVGYADGRLDDKASA